MQVIGWSMWFSEYLFLERSWAKDEKTLKVNFVLIFMWVKNQIKSYTCSLYAVRLYTTIYVTLFTCECLFLNYPHLILFKSCGVTFAGRSSTFKGLPTAFLVGPFCRRNPLYASKASSSSRVCDITRIAYTQERFNSSYKGQILAGPIFLNSLSPFILVPAFRFWYSSQQLYFSVGVFVFHFRVVFLNLSRFCCNLLPKLTFKFRASLGTII